MLKKFRTLLFWAHLVVAIPTAIVILIMSVTGVMLGFQKQMEASSDRANYVVAGNAPASAATVLLAAAKAEGRTPTAVTIKADRKAPAEARFGRGRTLFFDGATGAVLGDGTSGSRGFFRGVVDWHRWLGQSAEGRETGKAITGACNLAFLFLVLSGLYLWWPRNWKPKALRTSFFYKRGQKPKARDFNIHNAVGFWCFLPLALIVVSGVVISYPWASALVFRVVGEAPPQRQEGPPGASGPNAGGPGGRGPGERREGGGREGGRREGGREGGGREGGPRTPTPPNVTGVDALVAKVQSEQPDWRTIGVTLPREDGDPIVLAVDRGTGGQPQLRETLSFDRTSGALVKREGFGDGSAGRRLRTFLRFAHTGEIGGIPGQVLATLASLGAAILVWTGLALSWRRLLSWNARRKRGPRPAPASDL